MQIVLILTGLPFGIPASCWRQWPSSSCFPIDFFSNTLPTKAGASSSGELHLNAAGSIAGHQAEDVRDWFDVFHAPGKLAPSLGPVF